MQMFRQDDDGVYVEGMIISCLPESGTQVIDMPSQLVIVLALGKIHGKEILYAGQPDSLIGSHPQSLDEVLWLCYTHSPDCRPG